MSYKICFRFNREEYTNEVRIEDNTDIKSIIYRKFAEKEIYHLGDFHQVEIQSR